MIGRIHIAHPVSQLVEKTESLLSGADLDRPAAENAGKTPARYAALGEWEAQVEQRVAKSVESSCPENSSLTEVVNHVLRLDPYAGKEWNPRLFALAVLGCLTGDPSAAVDVGALSRLWWAGAETFDDIVDGAPMDHGAPGGWSPQHLLIGATACLTLIPQTVVEQSQVPAEVMAYWQDQLTAGSLAAMEGQLIDLGASPDITWRQVLSGYVGKIGAPYGRDAVMAVRLITAESTILRGWRSFGRLFGILRQVRNDNLDFRAQDEDLANGTATLLLAHAMTTGPSVRQTELSTLRAAARQDPEARAELRCRMTSGDIFSGYTARIHGLRDQAHELLGQLAARESDYRDVLHYMINEAADRALVKHAIAA